MAMKLVTAPATLPVTLDEAKAHCAIDFVDHDALLNIYISAATDEAEKFTGRAWIDQTWDFYIDAFPTGRMEIPKPPLIEVEGVYYRSSDGAEQVLDASAYVVDDAGEPGHIEPSNGLSWPTGQDRINSVRVRFRAGYIDDNSPAQANVPYAVKAAILLIVGTLYANRETVVVGTIANMLPLSAEYLLRRYRVEKAMA